MKEKLLDIVKEILKNDPQTRESDPRLFRSVYNKKINTKVVSYDHVSKMTEGGQLPSHESIRRTRQKIQEHFPELRGGVYNKRQDASIEVSDLVNTNFSQATLFFE